MRSTNKLLHQPIETQCVGAFGLLTPGKRKASEPLVGPGVRAFAEAVADGAGIQEHMFPSFAPKSHPFTP